MRDSYERNGNYMKLSNRLLAQIRTAISTSKWTTSKWLQSYDGIRFCGSHRRSNGDEQFLSK